MKPCVETKPKSDSIRPLKAVVYQRPSKRQNKSKKKRSRGDKQQLPEAKKREFKTHRCLEKKATGWLVN